MSGQVSSRPLALGWSVLAAAALAIGGGGEVAGQEITGDLDRFELFTECAPMSVHVTVWGDRGYGPREVELEERGQTMAEGRLRLARLLDSSYDISGPFLGVEVGRAGLRMMLFKTVHDHASGVEQYAHGRGDSVGSTHKARMRSRTRASSCKGSPRT